MPPPIQPAKEDQNLRQQVEEMELRNAAQREQAGIIMEEIEDKENRQALGLDIEFDVSKLITQGIVEKRGLKILDSVEAKDGKPGNPGLWMDMHTLTKQEDILTEQLVESVYENLGGGIKLSKPYYEAKATAMLAMAITRLNNRVFPSPPNDGQKQSTVEFQAALKGKIELFNIILKLPSNLVDSLQFIYVNLSNADVLLEGDEQKKSSRP